MHALTTAAQPNVELDMGHEHRCPSDSGTRDLRPDPRPSLITTRVEHAPWTLRDFVRRWAWYLFSSRFPDTNTARILSSMVGGVNGVYRQALLLKPS